MLDSISEQLLACQSALNQYIDEKRSIFPRLYFLSDDDLLELLGQARAGAEGRETVMQTHLKKLFPGTSGVKLGPGDMSITALCSDYGETFQLEHPVDIDCSVEVWLKNLETEMRSSLKNMTLKCVVTSSLQDQDPFSLPTQILCLAQNIRFTEQAERAITNRDLQKLKSSVEKENTYYASAELEDESERNKRQALILQCVRYLAVIQILIDNNVTSIKDWLWQKQLRFYLMSTKEVIAKMGLAQISYSYEYLGINTGQFVRTELADEYFLILTQSLHLGFVGNPFGPAGTGKTESVKALGGLFGRLVLVFNCDEAMDIECMGRLLTGLALCGAWGCFDEFNRLTADTLAGVSHQLASLLAAMQTQSTALLNGKQVSVSPWCGVKATMNPVGRGYGGRRALPASLARLLRPLAVTAPPARALAASLLAAARLQHAAQLASDLHDVFTMAGALVTGQRHYDWGLRALKAAVSACGVKLSHITPSLDSQRAALKCLLALNNMSKLTTQDAQRFENILSLVFTDVTIEESTTDPIKIAIESSVASLKLIHNTTQIQKCTELYEQLQQRMGVAIVGPPGSGKSTIRRLLKNALTSQGKTIVEYIICPKAMSRDCLLGNIDHDTRQWTDGVISTAALEVTNQPTDVWSWVICDGDVDPEWVEALNSVLDDNRLLTLPSGWRVQFKHNVNFIFETHSLEHASPATVSRLGIILFSEDISCDMNVMESWMKSAEFENEVAKHAVPLLYEVIKKCLHWLIKHKADMILKLYNITLVKQTLMQFEYVVQHDNSVSSRTTAEEIVYLAVQRSLVDIVKANAVDSLLDELSTLLGPPPPPPMSVNEWLSDVLLMSPRLAACEPVLRACLMSNNSHLLIIGPEACAKNVIAEHVIKECNSALVTIDCTPILKPSDIIAELKRNNVVRSGGQNSSKNSARFTLFVRSLHRAHVDSWGTSAVHSFLLQLIEYGGFWSRGNETERGAAWSGVTHARVVCTASVTPAAPPRFAASLAHLTLGDPEDDELLGLAKTWLQQQLDKSIQSKDVNALATTVLAMFKEITEKFTNRPHYKWNASHLKRWCENVKWHSPSDATQLVMALTSEANMIFRDRLVTDEDKYNYDRIYRNHFKGNNDNMYFTCKFKGDGVYMEAVDYETWTQVTQKTINQCLSEFEYNVFGISGAEACSELAVLCPGMARACNGGTLVCVGCAGVGRRAAALLATAALPASIQFLYHLTQFQNVFKTALASAGEGNRSLIMVCESAVNDVTLANIEALKCAQSLHTIPATMAPSLHNQHTMDNIKQNLGIVICLDSNQTNLSELIEKYPFLYNDSHFIWLDKWCDNTIRDMPKLVVERLLKENVTEMSKEHLSSIPIESFVKIYNNLESESMRAPCRYVNFIKSYINILNKKETALLQRKNMLSSGVEALRRARSEVSTMQKEASEQEVLLLEKQTEANNALDQISATVRATTDKREEMQALKKNIELENEKLQIQKKEIEAELASVEPVIAAARSAVGDIRPESLSESVVQQPKVSGPSQLSSTENLMCDQTSGTTQQTFIAAGPSKLLPIENVTSEVPPEPMEQVDKIGACREMVRSLRAPPDIVRDVLEGVLRLMGIADTSWHSMKNFLSKRGVKEDIRCMDASQISSAALASVERLLERRGASFAAENARRASAACAPLAAWVCANVAYARALQRVKPLQAHQAALHKNLHDAEAQVASLSEGLASVEARVLSLKEQLGQHSREAAALEHKVTAAKQTLQAAASLLQQLAHEYTAWEFDLEHIEKEISELNQRSLLAAAYIVYLPSATEPQAKECIKKWSSLIGFDDTSFSVINFLSSTEKQLKWDADGLPSDQSAVKNAVVIDQFLETSKSGLTPLIIDPDGEGMTWLRNTLANLQCEFISQHSEKLLTAVQYAVRLGRILVITDVDRIHESWSLLLSGLPPASLGSPLSATLVLQCRDETLLKRLPAHYADKLSIVHFTGRLDGLTDQLIHYVLQQQNPEISEKSKQLKIQKAELQKRQHELQENLLRDLSGKTDILHDTNLLESLNKTRATSATIAEALEAARVISVEDKRACERYEASARKGAMLALAVRRLAVRYPLVGLPVDALLKEYVDAVKKNESTNIKNEDVIKYFTRRIIERVLLALHKKDKYIVVLHLLRQVYEDLIPDKLWQMFIGNYEISEENIKLSDIKNNYKWIPNECVKGVAKIKFIDDDLYNRLNLQNEEFWKEFLSTGDINILNKLKLQAFETTVVVAVIRPDSLYRAIVAFVDFVLGPGIMSVGGGISMARRASRGRPVLLLGAHAPDVLAAHALPNALLQVDVEQGASAWQAAVEAARSGGGWLAITVAASPFTTDLQAFVAQYAETCMENRNDDFQMWILSEDREVPAVISNACLNVILEAPEGVKNNIMGTLSAWGNYEAEPSAVRAHACLALFHALVQERRAYIPQGWSQWYGWEWSEICGASLAVRVGDAGAALVPAWYGSRVHRAPDARALHALAARALPAAGARDPPHLPAPLPHTRNLQAYASVFAALPDIDSPELLGLPANCRLAWEKNAALAIVTRLRELESTVNVKQTSKASLKTILGLWKKQMSGSPLLKGQVVSGSGSGWWSGVAAGEVELAARVARGIHTALAGLARKQTQENLLKVPEEWQVLWAGPEEPDVYIKEFCHRSRAAITRLDKQHDMPTEVDLRSFLVPSSVVWALRARTAALTRTPPHRLALVGHWNTQTEDAKSPSISVVGVRISGGACTAEGVARAAPHHAPHAAAHNLHLKYITLQEDNPSKLDSMLEIPVYNNEHREELVFTFRAPLARSLPRDVALLNTVALFIAPLD